jgi:hypothetical protein
MSALTDYTENKIIKAIFGGANFASFGDNIYIGLLNSAANSDAGIVTEISGKGYRRRQVPAANWDTSYIGEARNTRDISFGSAGSNWGIVLFVGIYDALTAGNLLAVSSLTLSRNINNGDPVIFNANTLLFGVNQGDPVVSTDISVIQGIVIQPTSHELSTLMAGIGKTYPLRLLNFNLFTPQVVLPVEDPDGTIYYP